MPPPSLIQEILRSRSASAYSSALVFLPFSASLQLTTESVLGMLLAAVVFVVSCTG